MSGRTVRRTASAPASRGERVQTYSQSIEHTQERLAPEGRAGIYTDYVWEPPPREYGFSEQERRPVGALVRHYEQARQPAVHLYDGEHRVAT